MKLINDNQKIRIKTTCGELCLKREYFYCRNCGYSEAPLDQDLEIAGLSHKMTRKFMVEVAYFAQNQVSFGKASEWINRVYKMDVNEETIRTITEEIGKRIFEADTKKAEKTVEKIQSLDLSKDIGGTLYIMIDGAAVNTRIEDENGSTWRENKLVMAFTDKDMIKRKDGGNIIVKKEYMPYIGNCEEFKKYALEVAVRAGYGKLAQTVVVGDGATWIRNMCDEIFPDAIQILDLFHLKENIYTYAKYLFNQDASKYTPWAEVLIDRIEKGKADEALALIPQTKKLPTGVVNIKTYIENNRDKINYTEYREKGYFVGSGAIESANKTIVQQRLKRAGMRWGVPGAQALLTLRAKDESHLWHEVERAICA